MNQYIDKLKIMHYIAIWQVAVAVAGFEPSTLGNVLSVPPWCYNDSNPPPWQDEACVQPLRNCFGPLHLKSPLDISWLSKLYMTQFTDKTRSGNAQLLISENDSNPPTWHNETYVFNLSATVAGCYIYTQQWTFHGRLNFTWHNLLIKLGQVMLNH